MLFVEVNPDLREWKRIDLSPGIGSAGRKGIDLTTLGPDQKPDREPRRPALLLRYCITGTCTLKQLQPVFKTPGSVSKYSVVLEMIL